MKDDEDILKLWQQATEDCTPLGQKCTPKKQSEHNERPVDIDYLYDAPTADGNKSISYYHNISPKHFKRLQHGEIPYIKHYDFHHYTTEEMHQVCLNILNTAPKNDHQCILMIHGKGQHTNQQSTLKGYLQHLLSLHPRCRAFCSAIPKDGGTGSLYVLI